MVRQDFILRMIERLIALLAEIVLRREMRQPGVAMHLVLHALRNHLGLDLSELGGLEPDAIQARLMEGHPREAGLDRCLAFAALNRQVGLIYCEQGQTDLARRAFGLALEFTRRGRQDRTELPPFAPDPDELAGWIVTPPKNPV